MFCLIFCLKSPGSKNIILYLAKVSWQHTKTMNWNCTKTLFELHHPIIATVQFLMGVCKHPVSKVPFFIYFTVIPWGTKQVLSVLLPIKLLCVSDYKADILLQFFKKNPNITMSAVKAAFALLERYCSESVTALCEQCLSFPFPSPSLGELGEGWEATCGF